MNRVLQKVASEWLKQQNAKWPSTLRQVPEAEWGKHWKNPVVRPVEVWRSRDYLVQVYEESRPSGALRMTVSRTQILPDGNWEQDIPWADIHEMKAEIGRGDKYAVEVYPRDIDLVNVANLRHIWILPEPLNIGWFKFSADVPDNGGTA